MERLALLGRIRLALSAKKRWKLLVGCTQLTLSLPEATVNLCPPGCSPLRALLNRVR